MNRFIPVQGFCGLLLCMCQLAMAESGVRPLSNPVDLDRYLGSWYEIARLPNRFQDQCSGDVTAQYSRLEDGQIQVINRCRLHTGKTDEAVGVARIVNAPRNSQLEVSFVSLFGWHFFWGDYWVLGLDPDYQWVVVGEPSRKYGWVLARQTELSEAVWHSINQILVEQGYQPAHFQQTQHGSSLEHGAD